MRIWIHATNRIRIQKYWLLAPLEEQMRRKYVLFRTIVTNCTKVTNQLTRSRVLGGSEQLVKSRVDHIGDIAQVQLLQ